MIIVCDLDRTLIPNGDEEYDNSLEYFYKKIYEIDGVILVYASGRNLELFWQANKEYGIKIPDYFLGSVGTEVYKKKKSFFGKFFGREDNLVVDLKWGSYVIERHPNWKRKSIVKSINNILDPSIKEEFYLQEDSVQNPNKISYYLKDENLSEEITGKIKKYLDEKNISAEVVYSYDPYKKLGLVDVLPRYATKLGAVEFLAKKLNHNLDDVIYCGDSGNDLLPLTSGIKSVLVKNARQDVKEKALEIVRQKGIEDKLYIAKGDEEYNGNYSSGVIEGLKYFDAI